MTDNPIDIIIPDIVIVACCLVLHVSMMLRFHARPDLGPFRAGVLALSAFFGVLAVVFAWDIYEVATGQRVGTEYVRWGMAAFAVVTAVVLADPRNIGYYKRIVPPDVCDEHRREIQRLTEKLGQGDGHE